MNLGENSKEKRIKKELSRISKFFEKADGNQRALVAPLLQNAAFMAITLEDLQETINAEGATDEYQNGANQRGIKQSATLQSYNALIKNYTTVIKALSAVLPPEEKALASSLYQWQEKTDAEAELQIKYDQERTKRINAEIALAAEKQKLEKMNWENAHK